MPASLADRLRADTKALHTAAERSTFMRALLRGELTRDAYCALLRNLHAVYAAMEPALARHAARPELAPFQMHALRRAGVLLDDLSALQGLERHGETALRQSTLTYVQRLHELDAVEPELLLAHAYVRYLGDLSGGQILRGIVARSLGTPGHTATAFYEFGDEQETQALSRSFRAALGDLVLGGSEIDALVEEAAWSFRLHRLMFDELAQEAGLTGTDAEGEQANAVA